MLSKTASRRSFGILSQTLKKSTSPSLHYPLPSASFSNIPYFNPEPSPQTISQNSFVHDHMKNVYKYITISTAFGIGSTYIISAMVPLGAPFSVSAYMILLGFGLEHLGGDYLDRTRAKTHLYKGINGLIQYGTSHSIQRKLALLASSLGYSCIMSMLLGFTPVAIQVLPSVAAMCLASTLGQIDYCRRFNKGQFKFSIPGLFIYGATAGITALNVLTGFAGVADMGMSKYLGLILYNMSITHDSIAAANEANNGKADYLKHANGLSQSWLFALLPFLILHNTSENSEFIEGSSSTEDE